MRETKTFQTRFQTQHLTILEYDDNPWNRPSPFHSVNNLTLTIHQKYNFIPMNPDSAGNIQDSDKKSFPAKNWTEEEWLKTCNEFIGIANHYWDNKFWLHIPDSCHKFDYLYQGLYIRPNIKCRYNAEWVKSTSTSVIQVKVANPNKSGFRSDNTDWTPEDAQSTPNFTGNSQVTVVHEVGHNLDQTHVSGEKGNLKDYGGRNPNPKSPKYHPSKNIMGGGMTFTEINALPWQLAMQEFTNINSTEWKASMMELFPGSVELIHSPIRAGYLEQYTEMELYTGAKTIVLPEIVMSGRVRHHGNPHKAHKR